MKRNGSRKQDLIKMLAIEMVRSQPVAEVQKAKKKWAKMKTDELETIWAGI